MMLAASTSGTTRLSLLSSCKRYQLLVPVSNRIVNIRKVKKEKIGQTFGELSNVGISVIDKWQTTHAATLPLLRCANESRNSEGSSR